ncbi:alpha/beta fold hydrolase [Pimelobacter simplex]|uniref:Putative exported protease n=1 Tax=Nocardioides simplex TaxID=2045 RepID=A0A0A1DW37_NOCSI|nr:alpha/beta hydrolase [Pimelobacter simplex]AIY19650.2 putative exported protease [Pimelobacter simplex]MCG8150358.1 alpha/beta fold hydrolase [Pimelobacter simplex]GEB16725.1 proteinase [Pimelobacter simplex]SFM89440.1 alpha/beta hydrolase fold [Pimelobacter simplex]
MSKKLIVAVVVVWALVLAGGVGIGVVLLTRGDDDSGKPGADGSTPPSTKTQGPDGRTIEDFYQQKLSWSACGSNECTTLEVPIDYQKPGDGSIELALERTKATGTRIGSLVINPGGPGAPGTSTVRDAQYYFAPELMAAYDIVGFDPRGTGKSAPVDCLSDSALDAYIAADPDPDTPEEVKQAEENSADFWAGCKARSGTLGGHVSTVEAARDMDVLRAALGEDKLDYLGFSYGTRLGATYAELYPENTGRLVLDGAIDPSLSSRDGALSQAAGFETALRSYVQSCVDAGSCFLGDSVDAGLSTIKGLLDTIDKEPLTTKDPEGRKLTVGLAFYGLITPLYAKDNWSYLDDGLKAALDGDGSTLLTLADFYGSREGGRYTDNSLEAISVINCLDDPWSITPDEVPGQFSDFEKASPTFGKVFAWGLTACDGEPFTSTDEPDLKIDGSGAAPIVVLGTTRDPATPYKEAVAMAQQLESAVLVTREGDGHTAYNKGNSCIDDAVHAYLIEGTVPRDGLKC